jgi:hypothetical protein
VSVADAGIQGVRLCNARPTRERNLICHCERNILKIKIETVLHFRLIYSRDTHAFVQVTIYDRFGEPMRVKAKFRHASEKS